MTPSEIEGTPIGTLTVEEVLAHLFARDSVRAALVMLETTEDGVAMFRIGTQSAAVGLHVMAGEMLATPGASKRE